VGGPAAGGGAAQWRRRCLGCGLVVGGVGGGG
jgi:hypothetical protein